MNNEIAQIVSEAIEKHNTETVSSVALKSGIPRVTLIRKLNGGSEFGVYEIARIAIALGIHPGKLLPSEFKNKRSAA
ncbi:hypothetical protein [Glutamicibacter creatinolyticus]|uniref:hypothetical protein n=1 Tax=Glutamicibacter creatinolyticus TaxID=162496 RepID=UPI0032163E9B